MKVKSISFFKSAVTCILLCGAVVMFFCQNFSCSSDRKHKGAQMIVDTSEIGKGIKGFGGVVPVKIFITDGVIDSIQALPNSESPGFFRRVVQSGLLKTYEGKTLKEASKMTPDAVSGATYSSKAVISNIQLGIKKALADAEKSKAGKK